MQNSRVGLIKRTALIPGGYKSNSISIVYSGVLAHHILPPPSPRYVLRRLLYLVGLL